MYNRYLYKASSYYRFQDRKISAKLSWIPDYLLQAYALNQGTKSRVLQVVLSNLILFVTFCGMQLLDEVILPKKADTVARMHGLFQVFKALTNKSKNGLIMI